MKTIFANTSDELYKAVSCLDDINDSVKIVLKKNAVYELNKPISINRDNVALLGENTILKGSKRIPICGNDNIVEIKLNDYEIHKMDDFSEGPFKDFWFDYQIPKPYMDDCGMGTSIFYEDEQLPLSRYPKSGFIKTKKIVDTDTGMFIPEDKKIFSWSDYQNLMIIGYWKWEWANQRCRIKSLEKDTISVMPPYHCFGYKDDAHYYILNVKDEISDRGEWSKDIKNNTITLYPKENQKYIDITVTDNVIEADGVDNLNIKGIFIKECKKNGIKITNSKNIKIDTCQIKNVGGWGVIADECENTVIKNVFVTDTGGGGIAVSGGNRKNLIPSNNLVKKCLVSRVAKWHRTYMAGIQICGVGCCISECKICDVPHFAIVYHGNNHIIENNEMSDVCYEANDAGAIYSGADWTCRGNIIRHNYFHDINGFMNNGCYGIYFDDYVSSARVYDNIFVKVHQGILIGGGRDYIICNNSFFNCVSAVIIDDRANVRNDVVLNRLFEKAKIPDYKSSVWHEVYPELYDIENQNYDIEANNKVFCNKVMDCEEYKNFVYIKNGERFEYTSEEDFCKVCNKVISTKL